VGDREVEFGERAFGATREFYAELEFPSREEAERFARSLKAIGIDARIAGSEKAGYAVRLDSDSFFGLLAVTNATPPGLTPLYRSKDLQVYAAVKGGRMRFYFAVKHEGMWRAVEGLYKERSVNISRKEREVLEAVRDAVTKALEQLKVSEKLGRPAKVGELSEIRDEKGNVRAYYFNLYDHHLTPFLGYAAETVQTQSAEVRLEGRRIVISAGDIKVAVEFKLLKRKEAEFFPVQDLGQTLALYKSLKALGVPVEITPKGVKVDGEAMWALVAAAVEKAVEKGELDGLPVEVMPGVELLKAYNAGGMKLYIFRAEGVHYYFAVKTEKEWRVAGGKRAKLQVQITGEAAPTIAEAINALYREMGVDRRIEVKYDKRYNAPYIYLTNVDLRLLDIKREPL